MKVAITGGSGFIGQELTRLLLQNGHEVYILTRSQKQQSRGNIHMIEWLNKGTQPELYLDGMDAWVNLAGASINEGRWNEGQKQQIYESRMEATDEAIRIIETVSSKPSVLVNASAIGIYPASIQATYTESSEAIGSDFLARTVKDWEQKAYKVEKQGIRVAIGRFGIILGKDQGALPLMALPYKLGIGGKVGTGEQWMSWVHVDDTARALLYAIENDTLKGVFNVTSPFPVQMSEFGKVLGEVLHRPHWLPVPSIALKAALGEKSQLVLEGQRVLPDRLLVNGFKFTYPTLQEALKNIYA